jgi:hypothetical protein
MSFLNPRTNAGPWLERRKQPQENLRLCSLAHAVIEAAQKLDVRMLGPAEPNGNWHSSRECFWQCLHSVMCARSMGRQKLPHGYEGPNLHRLYGDDVPDAATLQHFRSANRGSLQFCLKAALRCLAEQKVTEGWLTKWSEQLLAEEASHRVTMAMFTDSLDLDKKWTSVSDFQPLRAG